MIFDEIVDTRERIKQVQEKLDYIRLQASTPRSPTLSDMPKGGGGVDTSLERYIIKQEELAEKIKTLKTRLNKQWTESVHLMSLAKINEQDQKMMYLRFGCGMQWEKCADELNKLYPTNRWNIGKCFREYRKTLQKIKNVCKNQTKSIDEKSQ